MIEKIESEDRLPFHLKCSYLGLSLETNTNQYECMHMTNDIPNQVVHPRKTTIHVFPSPHYILANSLVPFWTAWDQGSGLCLPNLPSILGDFDSFRKLGYIR